MKKLQKKYLREVVSTLSPLAKIPKSQTVSLLPLLSDDCIHKICETCQNFLMNSFNLDKRRLSYVRKKYNKSKKDIRILASPSVSLLRKRKILRGDQTGRGVISILASIALPALLSALSK